MLAIAVGVAVAIELGLLAYVLITAQRERAALARFVDTARDLERLKQAARSVPAMYQPTTIQFAGELARKGTVDEALVNGLTRAANTTFGPGAVGRLLLALGLLALVLSPLVLSLGKAALAVTAVRGGLRQVPPARLFLQASGDIEPSFRALAATFDGSAMLLVGLVLVGALHWWLNRSELREARLIQALLEAAIIARPSSSAPVAGRLSALLSPNRALKAPVFAWVFFFLASGTGFGVLHATAGVKSSNGGAVYDVMAEEQMKLPRDIILPTGTGGGSAATAVDAFTISVGEEEIAVPSVDKSRFPFQLDHGELPADWAKLALPLPEIAQFAGQVRMPTHRSVPVATVLALIRHLAPTTKRVHLMYERSIMEKPPESRRVYAILPIVTEVDGRPVTMTLEVNTTSVNVLGGAGTPDKVQTDRKDTARQITRAVRLRTYEENREAQSYRVGLVIKDPSITVEKLIQVLAAADNSCPLDQQVDCGIPGVGLEFVLQ